jgi:hypothetical protein
MARRRRSSLVLSAQQAQAALGVLVHEGKLKAGEIRKALQRRDRLIKALRASLAALEAGVVSVGKGVLKHSPFPMAGKRKTAKLPAVRRTPRISPAVRKMYQAQGRYMAALRNLSKEQRTTIKAIREKSGVRAAIAAARSRLAEQRFIASQSKDSDQRRKRRGKRRSYPARPDSKPDKHGGSGAGRQQGGSGMGREHG